MSTIRALIRRPDIRRRLLITITLLVAYQMMSTISVPGLDLIPDRVAGGAMTQLLALFGGGVSGTGAFLALGIGPYITASLLMQLVDHLRTRLQGQAPAGDRARRVRMATALIAPAQAAGLLIYLRSLGALDGPSAGDLLMAGMVITAGAMVAVWVAERISAWGIGQGTGLIIVTGIAVQLVPVIWSWRLLDPMSTIWLTLILLASLFGVLGLLGAERRMRAHLCAQERASARHLALGMIPGGVTPVIFALSFALFPSALAEALGSDLPAWLSATGVVMTLLQAGLIVIFALAYVRITTDPVQAANTLAQQSVLIDDASPGQQTADHIGRISMQIAIPGAIGLALIAVLPQIAHLVNPALGPVVGGTAFILLVGVGRQMIRRMRALALGEG